MWILRAYIRVYFSTDCLLQMLKVTLCKTDHFNNKICDCKRFEDLTAVKQIIRELELDRCHFVRCVFKCLHLKWSGLVRTIYYTDDDTDDTLTVNWKVVSTAMSLLTATTNFWQFTMWNFEICHCFVIVTCYPTDYEYISYICYFVIWCQFVLNSIGQMSLFQMFS